jgi:phage terminase large subunit-like protein
MTKIATKIEKEQIALLELLKAKEEAIKYNRISLYYPDEGEFRRELYPKHVAFMNSTEFATSIAFMAANRVGKTLTGGCLMSWHLTGLYPKWYKGRRFIAPVDAWAAGITNESTRDIQQKELLGSLIDPGTGLIPKDCILKIVRKSGLPDAVATIYVRHISGGVSQVNFKSYDQGRDSFQGTKKQVIWLDEEPRDKSVYTECITRTMDAGGKNIPGIIMCTFTPLFGMTEVALSFLDEDCTFPDIKKQYEERVDSFVCNVGWDDCPHISEKEKARLKKQYPAH